MVPATSSSRAPISTARPKAIQPDGPPRRPRLLRRQADRDDLGIGEADDGDGALVPAPAVAGDDLGHHLALRHGAMGQHRLAGDVAYGEDAAHRGAALVVHADGAAGHVEVDLLQPPALRRRPAADGDQHVIGGQALVAGARLDQQRVLLRRQALRLRPGHHRDAQFLQPLGDGLRQLGVVERQDAVGRLDHRHLGAHLGEGGAELQPDIAAADHGQRLGQLRQRQRPGGGNHLAVSGGAAEGQRRQLDRHGAGGDDDLAGADEQRAGLCLHLDRLAVAEAGAPGDRLDARLLEQAGDAVVQAADDVVLPADGAGKVELRRRDRDAQRGGAGGPQPRLLELIRGVDQRLGRDAADIEAGAARPVLLDDDGVESELAGADRADIAARAGADDEERAGDLVHGVPSEQR